ncbi:MAG: FecR domain-containing protein [Saprospiraceae bacterium]|nr:FecR domain-containing protein [Saprospiraceae bacterium]
MDTKKTYQNIEALAADLEFILWVKSGESDPKGDWYQALVEQGDLEWIDPARDLVRSIGFQKTAVKPERLETLWAKIDAKTTDVASDKPAKVRWLNSYRIGIAATLALLIGLSLWWMSSPRLESASTHVAETRSVELPDGSMVNLNAESQLFFPTKNWEDKREVILQGEAFFEVAKGEKFAVKTDQGLVEVLGTSFNVFDRGQVFLVQCHSGKVRVRAEGQVVLLEPGQKAQLLASGLIKSNFQVDPQKTWMKGYFLYQDAKLSRVFDEIERQFDVNVITQGVDEGRRYSGFFMRKNLSEALQAICWPLRLNFDINGKEVTISQDTE